MFSNVKCRRIYMKFQHCFCASQKKTELKIISVIFRLFFILSSFKSKKSSIISLFHKCLNYFMKCTFHINKVTANNSLRSIKVISNCKESVVQFIISHIYTKFIHADQPTAVVCLCYHHC